MIKRIETALRLFLRRFAPRNDVDNKVNRKHKQMK
jgi:hypothetical protein